MVCRLALIVVTRLVDRKFIEARFRLGPKPDRRQMTKQRNVDGDHTLIALFL